MSKGGRRIGRLVYPEHDLLLIDGSHLVYRAHYSMIVAQNSKGISSGALFGTYRMLMALLSLGTKHMVFVLDPPGGSFRNDLYAGYKGGREGVAEIHEQIPDVKKLVKALGIPILCIKGYEADDVLATLAKRNQNLRTIILTGDKDLCQLVGGNVLVMNPAFGLMDRKAVKDKYGVYPKQIRTWLALAGDGVDRVKGVPGCGRKTAVKLVNTYGTTKHILENVGEIKGRVGKALKLRSTLKNLKLALKLVRLESDVPGVPNVAGLGVTKMDHAALARVCDKYDIRMIEIRKAKIANTAPKRTLFGS